MFPDLISLFLSGNEIHQLKKETPKNELKIVVPTTVILNYIAWPSCFLPFLFLLSKLLEDNTVKLYDVSVCKEVDSTEGTFRGTPQYMAPEVLRSELNDFKSDIYSLGIMLWEIWYGRQAFPHFDSKNIQHFINSVIEGCRPKEETKLKLNKPPRLWKELMEKCWDGNPKKRPKAKECEETITKLFNEWRV